MFTKILAGTDGFGPASAAISKAADLAAKSDAELIVVSAYAGQKDDAFAPGQGPSGVDAANGLLRDVEKNLGGSVKLRTEARQGSAADVLLDVAEEHNVDLIVIGNKGMTGTFHIGSVPDRISHHAPCSVLIVHTTE